MKIKCKGRLHTINEQLVEVRNQHNHGPDLADCEVRATLQTMKDVTISTTTSHHLRWGEGFRPKTSEKKYFDLGVGGEGQDTSQHFEGSFGVHTCNTAMLGLEAKTRI